jgi:hypothetical protein
MNVNVVDNCWIYIISNKFIKKLTKGSCRHVLDAPYTGCAVTPCSVISQASCRNSDDRRGAALPQEDVGNMLVKTIFKKSSAKAAIVVTATKRQEVGAHRYAVFSRRRCCDAVCRRRQVLFFK